MTSYVHRSHEMERLAERLVELAFVASDDPFACPHVVVQGQGMERWLAQHCADATGVFAGVQVTRVRGFVAHVCDLVLGDDPEKTLDPSTLVFRVAKHVDAVASSPEGAPFSHYLAAHDVEQKMQLAERLAEVFDRYFVHRPRMVAEWLAGKVEDDPLARAQAALLARIVDEAPAHESKRVTDTIARLDSREPLLSTQLPKRVFLFGVGTLAPLYLDLFRKLGELVDVHLFVLTPGEVWLSDLSHEESSRGEIGSMIRGFGKLAAEFQDLLEGPLDHHSEYLGELPREPKTILEVLRHDLCTLTQRGDVDGRAPKVVVADDDRSFVVHACHSPQRELEALHEMLVDRLERDRTLRPNDIAVLTTDVERYAPLVHAVFGRERDPRRRIPYHVADRGPRASFGLVDAFVAVLDALDSRVTLPLVADLLERHPVRAKLGLDRGEVQDLVGWLRDAGGRSGLDAADRVREGQPPFVEHTFEHALDRLALGFAIGDVDRVFRGLAPAASAVGKEGVALSALFGFFDALESLRADVKAEATVSELVSFGERALATMLDHRPPFDEEAGLVRQALAGLRERAASVGFEGTISLPSFVRMLLADLDEGSAGGFLGGGVTFCRQVPMRAIPFRVICLLGLDDGLYPRNADAPGFDLVARDPRKGDRNPRDDDRQAFLDTLLSARDALHLFHVGRDIATDTERAVSAVVSRTLEVVEGAVVRANGRPVRELVWVDHPLQGFDPRYFVANAAESGLVSRDPYAFRLASATIGEKRIARVAHALARDPEPISRVDLDDLLRFLRDPAKDFLTRVLGIRLLDEASELPDREPIELDGLDRYRVFDRVLELDGRGAPASEILADLRRRGELPPGAAGEIVIDEALRFATSARECFEPGPRHAPIRLSIDLGGTELTGTLGSVHETGIFVRRASKLSAKHRLELFVELLALSLTDRSAVAPRATLVARNPSSEKRLEAKRYDLEAPSAADARAMLGTLVDAYVAARREPVLVDPDLLDTYARARNDKKRPADRAAAMRRTLEDLGKPRDEDDAYAKSLVVLLADSLADSASALSPELLGSRFLEVAEGVFMRMAEFEGGKR